MREGGLRYKSRSFSLLSVGRRRRGRSAGFMRQEMLDWRYSLAVSIFLGVRKGGKGTWRRRR